MEHTTANPARSKGFMVGIVVSAILAIIGIVLWVMQVNGGFVNTNMRNADSWGLYIINFMWFVGLSAGGLIISSAPRVFGLKGFGGISKVATWVSICCTVLAMVFVMVDLGGPVRIWHLFAYANLTSPLMWDIIVLTIYLIVSIVYLWATMRVEKGEGSPSALRVLSVIALISAVLVHTVTAWIFGLLQAHEFWHTALLGPWFVSSALVSGLGLILVICVALRKIGYLEFAQDDVVRMVKLLGIFTAIDVYLFACDLLTTGFPGGEATEIVALLTTGALAPYFWCEIICNIVTMAIAFVPSLRKTPAIVLAGVLSVIAILAKRVQLLVGGFQYPNLDYMQAPIGVPLTDLGASFQTAGGSLVYFPSLFEFAIVIGVLGLGACILLLGFRLLPLKPVK